MFFTHKTSSGYFLPVIMLLAVAGVGMFTFSRMTKHDTKVEISENKKQFSISAFFPERKSSSVVNYLRTQLNVSDLEDFNWLEVKEYDTPDKTMKFHIKSRVDCLIIRMNKEENSPDAYQKLKNFGDGLKEVLVTK